MHLIEAKVALCVALMPFRNATLVDVGLTMSVKSVHCPRSATKVGVGGLVALSSNPAYLKKIAEFIL